MSVRHSVSEYLRSRGFEMEPDPIGSIREPLITENEETENNLDDVDLGNGNNVPPRKAFHGEIRLKSDTSNSTEDSTEFDDEILMYRQFHRHDPYDTHEEVLLPFEEHQCLSPTKPSAKAILLCIHAFDFTFGTFLITRGCLQMQDDYGSMVTSLILGMLLLGGSIAGFIHTPFCHERKNRSLTIFNIALGFISFGVYYVLSLLLLAAMATMSSFVGTDLGLGEQFVLCIVGFALSTGEVYRIMYVQYHYFSNEQRTQEEEATNQNDDGSVAQLSADEEIIEDADAIPSILFV